MLEKEMATEDSMMQDIGGTSDVASDAEDGAGGAASGQSEAGNQGWADVMTRLLSAPAPKKRYVVLAKAKKTVPSEEVEEEEEKQEQGPGFEVEGAEPEEAQKKPAKSRSTVRPRAVRRKAEIDRRKKLREWEVMGRKKPDIREKDREKTLCKIATRGVVQLFNAVRKQQQEVQGQLKEAGGSIRKTERALKGVSKQAFLERLRAGVDSEPAPPAAQEHGEEAADGRASWSVLRDDYLPEAGLKDWDQDSDMADDDGSAGESDDSA
ncbi:RRP15-like protein [Pollicipes pollicipes]|uniref:RRP15-like protein n=1 Tax=Pollicipes pollicipes TaxID=41117 RepID=UPI001884E35C|nr:RRP15-like protein [Pollicipes pollicipes]XP_037076650.1 RRP15-like protein [Pollicipes pollicipes]